MLKKVVIMLLVLTLFVGIFIVQAQPEDRYYFEDQYIDTLNMPWTKSVNDLETVLNTYYDKPETASEWKLQCADGLCNPYYIDGIDRHIIKTRYEFGTNNQLKSIRSEYDVTGYALLIERIEKDFSENRAVVTRAYQFAHHVYDKTYRNGNIKVEVKHTGINKPITFSATFKTIKEKKEGKDEDMAMAKGDPSILYRASFRTMLAYIAIRCNNVNF